MLRISANSKKKLHTLFRCKFFCFFGSPLDFPRSLLWPFVVQFFLSSFINFTVSQIPSTWYFFFNLPSSHFPLCFSPSFSPSLKKMTLAYSWWINNEFGKILIIYLYLYYIPGWAQSINLGANELIITLERRASEGM